VLDPALPFSREEVLKDPPRGDEDVDDPLACGWICGRAGSRSLEPVFLGA
jgi:hypothetical protein